MIQKLSKLWHRLAAFPGGPSTSGRLARGKIFLLDGIGGARWLPRAWAAGLRAAGLDHDLEEFYWSHGILASPFYPDAWNLRRNRRQAEGLAERVRAYRRDHPGRPVHVVAHSAGAGVAAFALERLAPDESVTSAVLVSSGLSPWYDLAPALARTTAGALAVHSPLDVFFLGIGTLLVGTVDRRHTPAAGLVGFHPPRRDPETRRAYGRLRQVWWGPGMLRQHWLGNHNGVGARRFVRDTLAAWVREAEAADGAG
jgi:hypothetical protein